jgi:hypothetical protein
MEIIAFIGVGLGSMKIKNRLSGKKNSQRRTEKIQVGNKQ